MSAAPHLLLVHSASNILACATCDVMRDPCCEEGNAAPRSDITGRPRADA